MCICIYKPKGKVVPEKHLALSFENNPDGSGYAFIDNDGKLHVKKGFMEYPLFLESYKKDIEDDTVAIIHFRIKSKGEVSPENCHPWRINDKLALIHQGTLKLDIPKDVDEKVTDITDSQYFAEHLMKDLMEDHPDIWKHSVFKTLLEGFIFENPQSTAWKTKPGNTMVFLHESGEAVIFHDKGKHDDGGWEEENGCWYSNESHKKEKKRASGTTTGAGYGTTRPPYSDYRSNPTYGNHNNSSGLPNSSSSTSDGGKSIGETPKSYEVYVHRLGNIRGTEENDLEQVSNDNTRELPFEVDDDVDDVSNASVFDANEDVSLVASEFGITSKTLLRDFAIESLKLNGWGEEEVSSQRVEDLCQTLIDETPSFNIDDEELIAETMHELGCTTEQMLEARLISLLCDVDGISENQKSKLGMIPILQLITYANAVAR